MEKQWRLHDPDPQTVRELTHHVRCDPLLARLLAIRGIQSKAQAVRYLHPSFQHLTPPQEMTGIQAAVQRIERALVSGEKILVFGDYDADGITATALLVAFLRRCDARVVYHIPHRIVDGYGLGADFIRNRALPAGIGLIITADCGSGSREAIRVARESGIHTIVTDHHPISRPPDAAFAVINPSMPAGAAHLAHLAGVGVAFYLIIALRSHLREAGFWNHRREPNLRRLCDLVALGTIADVAPLIGENRILTAAGLAQINRGTRPGIAALMEMSAPANQPVDAEAIAFRLAPRLNAAGRLVHARMACELLLTASRQRADRLARTLCRLNSRRQEMENALLSSILDGFNRTPEVLQRTALVVNGEGWHEGLIGIVAARLTRQFNRPAVVIATRNGTGKGSARSIAGIDLSAALDRCADLLERFGGHPLAAGFSLRAANITPFRERLETVIAQMGGDDGDGPSLAIDAQVPLAAITPQLMESLECLAPFGQGNPHPLFMDTQVRVRECRPVGAGHRRMVLQGRNDGSESLVAIQFNVTANPSVPVDRFEKIAYRPQWNYWNGGKRLQLMIEETVP